MLKLGPDNSVQLTQSALVAIVMASIAVGAWMTTITVQLSQLSAKVERIENNASRDHTAQR